METAIESLALAASSSSKVVNNGAILNQFTEPLRAVQDCMVLDLDKKQLKKLCMLLRWKFFGVGAANLVDPFACKHIIEALPAVCESYGITKLEEIIGGGH